LFRAYDYDEDEGDYVDEDGRPADKVTRRMEAYRSKEGDAMMRQTRNKRRRRGIYDRFDEYRFNDYDEDSQEGCGCETVALSASSTSLHHVAALSSGAGAAALLLFIFVHALPQAAGIPRVAAGRTGDG
jgi:hypothetical protein